MYEIFLQGLEFDLKNQGQLSSRRGWAWNLAMG